MLRFHRSTARIPSRAPRSKRLSLAHGLFGAFCAAALSGCFAYSEGSIDVDRNPVVDTGMRASVILPGQAGPSMGSQMQPRVTQRSGAGTESVQGPQGEAPITWIGGSEIDEKTHYEWKEQPQFHKYLMAPLALIAAPFQKLLGDSEPPEPGPPVPEQSTARPPMQQQAAPPDYETSQIQAMERELGERNASAPGTTSRPSTTPAPSPRQVASAPRPGASSISIADELSNLQRAPVNPTAPRATLEQPFERETANASSGATPRQAPNEKDVADGIVDRNDDGRIDMWIYRTNGEITRKQLDQNFDGRPDTTLHYDTNTHKLAQVAEDSDHDGAIDSWTDYRDGKVVRRRSDADGDGGVDAWTYYRNGEIARHEQDTTGDGFRDRSSFYREGHLSHEEIDSNADGLTDITNHYDSGERLSRREEDTDLDGDVDLISHYEAGRLARRELLDDEAMRR